MNSQLEKLCKQITISKRAHKQPQVEKLKKAMPKPQTGLVIKKAQQAMARKNGKREKGEESKKLVK